MCVLVEMWTGKMPWCFDYDHTQQSVMLLVRTAKIITITANGYYCFINIQVGRYKEETDFEKLVPYKIEGYEAPDNVMALLRNVLIKDSKNRPSARELLRNSTIIKGNGLVEE